MGFSDFQFFFGRMLRVLWENSARALSGCENDVCVTVKIEYRAAEKNITNAPSFQKSRNLPSFRRLSCDDIVCSLFNLRHHFAYSFPATARMY